MSAIVSAGIDVGYGNGKAVGRTGNDDELRTVVLPVGAAPVEHLTKNVNGIPDPKGGELVLIATKLWVAGIDPMHLQGFARQTHANYMNTDEYMALYFALLAKLQLDRIDYLVTGLPCQDFLNGDMRSKLPKLLAGNHFISTGFRCEVKNVYVVAQPIGSFMAQTEEDPSLLEREDRMTLVVDLGYGTADWCLLQGDSLRDNSSGSSKAAMSMILEKAAKAISKDYDNIQLSSTRLEGALKRNEEFLELGSHNVDFRKYLKSAAREVSRQVMADVATSLRHERDAIDTVVLTGGGASLFERATRDTFGGSQVLVSRNPVLDNARGFQIMAQRVGDAMAEAQLQQVA